MHLHLSSSIGFSITYHKWFWGSLHTSSLSKQTAANSGFKLLKPANNKFIGFDVISRFFQIKILPIHLISVSVDFVHFIFKICQTVAGISMTKQFHELFDFFGGFLPFSPTVRSGEVPAAAVYRPSSKATNVCKAVFKADDYYEALAGSTTKHQHFAAAPFSFKYWELSYEQEIISMLCKISILVLHCQNLVVKLD